MIYRPDFRWISVRFANCIINILVANRLAVDFASVDSDECQMVRCAEPSEWRAKDDETDANMAGNEHHSLNDSRFRTFRRSLVRRT